jgi:hypothetical protein
MRLHSATPFVGFLILRLFSQPRGGGPAGHDPKVYSAGFEVDAAMLASEVPSRTGRRHGSQANRLESSMTTRKPRGSCVCSTPAWRSTLTFDAAAFRVALAPAYVKWRQ